MDIKFIVPVTLSLISIYLAQKKSETDIADRRYQDQQQAERQEMREKEKLFPRTQITRENGLVKAVVIQTHPITGVETVHNLLVTEQQWKEIDRELWLQKRRLAGAPPLPWNYIETE